MGGLLVALGIIAGAFGLEWLAVHAVLEIGQALNFYNWEPTWQESGLATIGLIILRILIGGAFKR